MRRRSIDQQLFVKPYKHSACSRLKKIFCCLLVIIIISVCVVIGIVVSSGNSSSNDNSEPEYLITGSRDGAVILWDTVQGSIVREFTGFTSVVKTLAYDHVQQHYFAGGGSKSDGNNSFKIIEWDQEGSIVQEYIGHTDIVLDIVISANATQLLSVSQANQVILWNRFTGLPDQNLALSSTDVTGVFHNDDEMLVTSANSLIIWNLKTGSSNEFPMDFKNETLYAPYTANGKIYVATSEKRILQYDVANAQLLNSFPITSTAQKLAQSEEKLFVLANGDLFEQESGFKIASQANDFIIENNLAYVASQDGQVKVYQLNGEASPTRTFVGHKVAIETLLKK